MLLRASRASEALTKEALFGTVARLGFKAAGGLGKGLLKKTWKHKRGLGTAGVTVAIPAWEAKGAIRRADAGMSRRWTAARMQGLAKTRAPTF